MLMFGAGGCDLKFWYIRLQFFRVLMLNNSYMGEVTLPTYPRSAITHIQWIFPSDYPNPVDISHISPISCQLYPLSTGYLWLSFWIWAEGRGFYMVRSPFLCVELVKNTYICICLLCHVFAFVFVFVFEGARPMGFGHLLYLPAG